MLKESNHDILEFSIHVEEEKGNNGEHKEKRLNYIKGNYNGLRMFFGETDWS